MFQKIYLRFKKKLFFQLFSSFIADRIKILETFQLTVEFCFVQKLEGNQTFIVYPRVLGFRLKDIIVDYFCLFIVEIIHLVLSLFHVSIGPFLTSLNLITQFDLFVPGPSKTLIKTAPRGVGGTLDQG